MFKMYYELEYKPCNWRYNISEMEHKVYFNEYTSTGSCREVRLFTGSLEDCRKIADWACNKLGKVCYIQTI